MKEIRKKIIINFLIGVILFSVITPVLFFSNSKMAQGGFERLETRTMIMDPIPPAIPGPVPPVQVVADAPEAAKSVGATIRSILSTALSVAWKNALSMFLGNIAYETATYIGTGFRSDAKPMFFTDRDFWHKMRDSVLGDFTDQLGRALFVGLGMTDDPKFSFCDPILPELKLSLTLFTTPAPKLFDPEVRCSLRDRWERIKEVTRYDLSNIWQGVSLDEGRAPVFSLKQRIEISPNMTDDVKNEFVEILEWVLEGQEKIGSLSNRVQVSMGEQFDKTPFEKEVADLREDSLVQKVLLSTYTEKLRDCSRKDQTDFCNTPTCLDQTVCPDITRDSCLSHTSDAYADCQHFMTESIRYARQIDELVDVFEKALRKIENAIAKGRAPDTNVLEELSRKFSPQGSDLGAMSHVGLAGGAKALQEVEKSKWLQSLQGEFTGVTSAISGMVLTPSRLISDWASQKIIGDPSTGLFVQTGSAIADAINIFTTTLINTTAKTLFEGVAPVQLTGHRLTLDTGYGFGYEASRKIHADLAAVPLIHIDTDFDILAQYSSCPDKRFALPTQCVIDISFARAIEEHLTIKEAIERNLIKKNWIIGAKAEEDLMRIKKLRRARIMPLGLEIAAEKILRGDAPPSTIEEIVNNFYEDGSAFYLLVDPNWPLKAPKARCEIYGSSAVPLTGSSTRQETCINWKDCVGESEDGHCHTWGYCTRERNTWRFNGTECPSYYNTCQLFTRTKDNQKFSWLRKTLDFTDCDANSAGCQWYCQDWNPDLAEGFGMWSCLEPGKSLYLENGNLIRPQEDNNPYNAIFFNRQVESCDPRAEGCHQFIRTKENLGTNLLPNGSFENYTGTGSNISARGWVISNGQYINNEALAYAGKIYAKFNDAGTLHLQQDDNHSDYVNISLLPETKYTVSFFAKNEDEENSRTIEFIIQLCDDISRQWDIDANSSWQRYVFEFNTQDCREDYDEKISDLNFNVNGAGIALDNIQLETGYFSSYKEYGTRNQVYLKKAPDWMNCYNNETSAFECYNFIKSCAQEDVGCERYTPVTPDPFIPAVAKESDRCPAECVGYQSFREMPTAFYSEGHARLIPRTARTCPANEVGCEGFTNLEEVARGGEGREFYSHLRACQKPDGNCANFYIWVGSEIQGYQLKRYVLRKDENNPNHPANILDHERVAEEKWGKCSESEHAQTNPFCREFYSEQGEISYYHYNNTITCHQDCIKLRKNKPIFDSACWPELFDENGQPKIDGLSFEPFHEGIGPELDRLGICTFVTLPQESIRCSAVNEGCREYKGNNANNIRVSFFDNFSTGSYLPWQPTTASQLSFSTDSPYFGGYSLKVSQTDQGANPPFGAARPVNNLVFKGKSYLLSFLVKGTDDEQTISANFSPSTTVSFDDPNNPVRITQDWQFITLGPVYFDRAPGANEVLRILSDETFWLTNIQLKDTGSLYLIKDSWRTPCTCDSSYFLPDCPERENGPESMIGCAEYRDRDNRAHYLKSFSKICSEEVVGCEALINTQNSVSPFQETFNDDEAIVSADKMEYFVFDRNFSCSEKDKGCQKFGLPTLSHGEPINWTDFYFKNDPDLYIRRPILCQSAQQDCEEFRQVGAGMIYFKDPGDKICVWREKVLVGDGQSKTGWFKKDTNQPCYLENGRPYMPDGITYGIKYNDENGYLGFVGECEERFVGCNHYIEPIAEDSYYYLDNDQLDKKSCRGVSLKEGCVLFDDQLNPEKKWSARATYKASEADQSRIKSPINCTSPWLKEDQQGEVTDSSKCDLEQYKDTNYCKYCRESDEAEDFFRNDTNLILKVRRDRTCGEWLYCTGQRYVWHDQQQEFVEICDQFMRCREQLGQGDSAECTLIISFDSPEVLTEEIYVGRDIGWTGMDYSGYSLYNFYPIELLRAKNYQGNYALTYNNDQGVGGRGCDDNNPCPANQVCLGSPGSKRCMIMPTCQIYPEASSPFSRELENYYRSVNFCIERGGDNCQCYYREASPVAATGTIQRNYFNIDTDVEGLKVCVRAERPGEVGACCSDNCPPGMPQATRNDCTVTETGRRQNQGSCESFAKVTDYIGIKGYCLEPDLEKHSQTNACLTWFPGEAFTGLDPYNQVRSAGYFPASDRRWYGYGDFTYWSVPAFLPVNLQPFFPLGFNLTSSFPCQRTGGSFGYCGIFLSDIYYEANKEFTQRELNRARYGMCFYAQSEGGAQGRYLVYPDIKIKKESIERIVINYDFTRYNPGSRPCKELIKDHDKEKVCGVQSLRGYEPFRLTNNNDFGRSMTSSRDGEPQVGPCDDYFGEFINCRDRIGGWTTNEGACLAIQAKFDADNYLESFNVDFYDADKKGRAAIYDINVILNGGRSVPIKAYLAPVYNQLGGACVSDNLDDWSACQDIIGLSRSFLVQESEFVRTGDSGDNKEHIILGPMFKGNQRTAAPLEAVYHFSSKYWEPRVNRFVDRKVYDYMIDQIEIRYSTKNPDSSGAIILPQEKETEFGKELVWQREVGAYGHGSNRFFIQAIFQPGTGLFQGFKVEFNDDDRNDGELRIGLPQISLKQGINRVAKIIDQPYLPAVVNTNLIKLQQGGRDVYTQHQDGVLSYDYECLPRGATGFQGENPRSYLIYSGGTSPGGVCFLYSGGIYSTRAGLESIFPKVSVDNVYGLTNLLFGGDRHNEIKDVLSYVVSAHAWDQRTSTTLYNPVEDSPKVQPVRYDGNIAREVDKSGVTINNQYQGDIEIDGIVYTAYLKFYAWADGKYMPVREVIVDWGDGFQSGSSGMVAKNRRAECSPERDLFGGDPDACLEKYWTFVHTYVCNNPDGCEYQPKVYVKDNWGWCADAISEDGWAGDHSCIDIDRGVSYSGRIIMRPPSP